MSSRIHVFAVAVEKYQQSSIGSVRFAENDARAFVNAWQALGADSSDCKMLLSAKATKTAIESSFKRFLNGVAKGDTVVFFFAGHGIAFNDVSYITTHDTQPGDIKPTSISLSDILKQIRKSKSDRVLLFIDACESGLPSSADMRSITSNFSNEEMKQFCEDATHHIGFAACNVDESSWSNPSLKHGIWSHAIIKALAGDAKNALDKGSLVTGDSLRDYLSEEVPILLRATRSGNETQTPCWFGNASKQFIVADLTQILAAKAAKSSSLGSAFKNASLTGTEFGSVKSLSGFRKGHHVPDGHYSAAEQFVCTVGADDVKAQADEIFTGIRDAFGYKRKEVSYECYDGAATIKTPDFDVDLTIQQDPDDASDYMITTVVSTFRSPDVISEDAFNDLLSAYCDTVYIEFSEKLDMEEKIDEIEDIPALKKYLDYEPDCSSFSLELSSPKISIQVTTDSMTLTLTRSGDLKTLLAGTQKALATLSGKGVALLLPGKTNP
jgi:hypothetical protein